MPGEPPGPSDPPDPAGLVGRAAEAAAIRRMLDGAPLVTVTGLPGVGKTAVSLAAARAAAAGFADGSLLLRLDRLRDEALLPHTIAAALRLPDQYTRSRLDQLLLYTDGVSEARDSGGRFFPLAQVTADAVRGTGPDRAPLLDFLVARLDEHLGDRRCDDILLLLVTMR